MKDLVPVFTCVGCSLLISTVPEGFSKVAYAILLGAAMISIAISQNKD